MKLVRPLLAAKTTDDDLKRIRYPKLMSPKIDGVRAIVVGGRLLSRTMKPIPNFYTQGLFGIPELEGLDGELIVGEPTDDHLCDTTRSGVMSHAGKPLVSYRVFDKWDEPAPFLNRLEKAAERAAEISHVHLVEHQVVKSYDDVLELEEIYLSLGYEGGMLRHPSGIYKQNRSTLNEEILLKVKRFIDEEAIILECIPLYRNLNARVLDVRGLSKRSTHRDNKIEDDLLGALVVRDCKTGVIFNVGTGFTESCRRRIWDDRSRVIGKMIKYKKFAYGEKDKPRQGVFLGFRDLRDY